MGVRCEVKAYCELCLSDQHSKHACVVAMGVPSGLKVQPDMRAELTRIHQLYKQKQWDTHTTPTTCRWLLIARRKLMEKVDEDHFHRSPLKRGVSEASHSAQITILEQKCKTLELTSDEMRSKADGFQDMGKTLCKEYEDEFGKRVKLETALKQEQQGANELLMRALWRPRKHLTSSSCEPWRPRKHR